MKQLFLTLIVSLTGISIPVFSQSPELGKQVQNIIPPTPNVASIAKYGDIPVGYFTGSADIKLPIFQVPAKGMQLPITLSYSGNGIKVAEAGSWVGTGWSLSAGGVITRAVAGRPDEQLTLGFFDAAAFPSGDNYLDFSIAANRFDYEPDMFFYNFPGGAGKFVFNKQKQISCIPENKLDIAYHFAGYGSDNPSGLFHGARAIVDFTITAEDGMKYFFAETEEIPEQTRRIPVSNGPEQVSSNSNEAGTVAAPQSWFLSKMISPVGDTIYFDYAIRPITVKLPPSVTVFKQGAITGAPPLNKKNVITYVDQTTFSKQLTRIRFKSGSIEFKSYNARYDQPGDSTLDEIIIRNPQQQAIKRFRLTYKYLVNADLLPPGGTLSSYQPESIRLFLCSVQETDGTGTIVQPPHVFDYHHTAAFPSRNALAGDYWGYHNGVFNSMEGVPQGPLNSITMDAFKKTFAISRQANESFMRQGILTKITYPTGGSSDLEYEGHRVTTGRVPPYYVTRPVTGSYVADRTAIGSGAEVGRFSVKDLSGNTTVPIMFEYDAVYHNMASLSSYYFQLIDSATNTAVRTYTAGQCGMGTPSLNANNRYECRVNETLPNGTYKVVARNEELPPGALSDFTFYIIVGPWNELQAITPPPSGMIFGGMRIKKIISKDANGNIIGTKRFEYELDALAGDFGTYSFDRNITVHWDSGDGFCWPYVGNFEIFSFNSQTPLQQAQGSYVGYGKVRVFQETVAGNANNGYTEYEFASLNSHAPYSHFVTVPFIPAPNNTEWMYGLTLKERSYKQVQGGGYSLMKEVRNVYLPVTATTAATGTRRLLINEIEVTCITSSAYPNNQVPGTYYSMADYTIYTGRPVLDSVITTIYEDGQQIRQFEKYQYNNQFLLSKSITGNSQGELKETAITYPSDLGTLTATDPLTQGIKYLQNAHILSWPVEKSEYLVNANGTNRRLTSAVLSSYKAGQPVPELIYTTEGTPLTNFTPANTQTGAVQFDSRLKPTIHFNQYDAIGNLRQQQKVNDVPETYLWGYKGLYPVAKIVGADYATASQYVSQAVLNNMSISDTQLRNELNALRVNLPGALVHTYTYSLLAGVTSETGPDGKTVFYEYDDFLRLKLIRDRDGKIVKQFDYRYQLAIP